MAKISARGASLDERELKEEALDHVMDNRDDYNRGTDYEALGAAVYVEQIVTGERNDIELGNVTEYIARNDIDEQKFIEYKADLADDYDDFVGTMDAFFNNVDDLVNDLEAEGVMYQALYEEALNERDSAEQALQDILHGAADLDTGSDLLGGDFETGDDSDFTYPGGGRRSRRSRNDSGPSANFNFGEQEISGGFEPWANFNFGEQEVSGGWNDWSDYNFSWSDSGEDEETGGEDQSDGDWWDEFEPGWSGPVINNNQNRVVNRINILEPSES